MKRFSAVAVALLVAVSSSFGYWGYFPVIDEGQGEGQVNSWGGMKIRYSPVEKLELFATNSVGNLTANYGMGVRYQVASAFSLSLDMGIPYHWNNQWQSFGLAPGVQFSHNLSEKFILAGGAGLGLDFDVPNGKVTDNKPEYGLLMNFSAGLEIDYVVNEQVVLWAEVAFEYDRINHDKREDLEMKSAIQPALGVQFYVGNIILGTSLGIDLDATNREGKDAVGFNGGVDIAIKF